MLMELFMTILLRVRSSAMRFVAWLIGSLLGSFAIGFGAVFASWYWLDMPNFADGLITIAAGSVLTGLSLYHLIKQLRVWTEEH